MRCYKKIEVIGSLDKFPESERSFYEECLDFSAPLRCNIDDDVLDHVSVPPHFKSLPGVERSPEGALTLKDFAEEPQSFAEWKYFMSKLRTSSWSQFRRQGSRTVYMLPIGPFPDDVSGSSHGESLFAVLSSFGRAFFPAVHFEVLPMVEVHDIETDCRTRTHKDTGHFQILMKDLMRFLEKVLPRGGFAIMAVSWFDFYPCETMNNILGEGSALSGCAAISCGHYGDGVQTQDMSVCREIPKQRNTEKMDDENNDNGGCASKDRFVLTMENPWQDIVVAQHPQSAPEQTEGGAGEQFEFVGESNSAAAMESCSSPTTVHYETKMHCGLLWRMLKAFSHELCHVFGLTHCQFFECSMNASSSVSVVDRQPLSLCPVCLRKLQHRLGFSILERYARVKASLCESMTWCDTVSSGVSDKDITPEQHDDSGFVVIATTERRTNHNQLQHGHRVTGPTRNHSTDSNECYFAAALLQIERLTQLFNR